MVWLGLLSVCGFLVGSELARLWPCLLEMALGFGAAGWLVLGECSLVLCLNERA